MVKLAKHKASNDGEAAKERKMSKKIQKGFFT